MKARISALIDSEAEAAELSDSLAAALRDDEEAREAWRMYHLISDAISGTGVLSPGFSARVARRLNEEPALKSPVRAGSAATHPAVTWLGHFAHRYVYPAAVSIAAVAFVGWLGFLPPDFIQSIQPPAQVAALPVPAKKPESPVIRIPPPEAAHEYLLAHQGFSPRNELQGVAPYVRTVADESAGQGKR